MFVKIGLYMKRVHYTLQNKMDEDGMIFHSTVYSIRATLNTSNLKEELWVEPVNIATYTQASMQKPTFILRNPTYVVGYEIDSPIYRLIYLVSNQATIWKNISLEENCLENVYNKSIDLLLGNQDKVDQHFNAETGQKPPNSVENTSGDTDQIENDDCWLRNRQQIARPFRQNDHAAHAAIYDELQTYNDSINSANAVYR